MTLMKSELDCVERMFSSLDRLSKTLRKKKTPQITSREELDLLKAVSQTWLLTESQVFSGAPANDIMRGITAAFTEMLQKVQRRPSRAGILKSIRQVRELFANLQGHIVEEGSNPSPLSSSDPPPDFAPLIADIEMQQILKDRWIETQKCIRAGAHLAASVMMGGLLEGLLLARVHRMPDKAPLFSLSCTPMDKNTKKPKQLGEWMLRDFIDAAHELTWIGDSAKQVSIVVRDYRNFIHPAKQFSHKVFLDSNDTRILWGVFAIVAQEIVESTSP